MQELWDWSGLQCSGKSYDVYWRAVCALEQHHTAVVPAHFGNAILMQHVPAWGSVRKSKSIHISWKNHLQLRGAADWACPTQRRLVQAERKSFKLIACSVAIFFASMSILIAISVFQGAPNSRKHRSSLVLRVRGQGRKIMVCIELQEMCISHSGFLTMFHWRMPL